MGGQNKTLQQLESAPLRGVPDSQSLSEKRRHLRDKIAIPCLLTIENARYSCSIIDISVSGARLHSENLLLDVLIGSFIQISCPALGFASHGHIVRIIKKGACHEIAVQFSSVRREIMSGLLKHKLRR